MADPTANATCPGGLNAFGLSMYDCAIEYFGGQPAISQAAGWVIVVGFGAALALLTSFMVWLDYRYGGAKHTSEQFNTAGRSIRTGLVACDIVSKWTWAATLLQSSNVAWKYGVSGPFWYAAGATIQVLLFAVLAIEIKRKAPATHTVLEIVLQRWGHTAHLVFLVFCLLTNIIVTAMLILGGASVVNALTGINLYAAAFLIPVSVMFYTAHGGLKSTFIASWSHVAILYIALCTFVFMVYASPDSLLGSIPKVYGNLNTMAVLQPVTGNKEGSYLTMWSLNGLVFGIINIIGNFGTVFVDQAYWQSAIAAKPSATYKGYLLGGLCWFAIPFTMATTMGLGARALDLPLSVEEASAGLVPPAMATALMGAGGGFLLVLQLFMAVTASGSAEQIAVASLITYDVYRTYINPKATGKQIVLLSRIMILVYGCISGGLAVALLYIGLSLGWVYLFMGVVIGSAVFPIAWSICWKKCSAFAAITAALTGLCGGVAAWLITAQTMYGELSLDTTGQDYPMLAGNLVAILLSGIVGAGISLAKPQEYDWKGLLDIPLIEEDEMAHLPEEGPDSQAALDKALMWTYWTGGVLSIVMVVLWPCLALPAGVFSQGYFTFWVILAMIWGLLASVCCILLPVWEARVVLVRITKALLRCEKPQQEVEVDEPVEGKDAELAVKA